MGEEDKKGESWKKCPLCFVMISPKDLYTVFIESVGHYGVGDRLEFSLLTRQKDSNSALRRNENRAAGEIYDPFSKFTFTSDVDLSVRKAMADLDGWIAKADSGLVDDLERLPYVCAAMEHLEQRKKYWDQHRMSNSNAVPGDPNVGESLESQDKSLSSPYDEIKRTHGSPKGSVESKENELYSFYQVTQ